MASSHLFFLSPPSPLHLYQNQPLKSHQNGQITAKCISTSNSNSSTPPNPTPSPSPPQPTPPPPPPPQDFPYPYPTFESDNNTNTFPLEKRRKSVIIRKRKPKTDLTPKPEPPNYEIGWKRTKEIKLEKPKGYKIADFLSKLEDLMRRDFGSKELLVKAGEIVADRAREEAEVLRDDGEVEERMVTELFRVLRLMEMDLAMVKASVKDDTLSERIQQAIARCRQAILVAMSF